MRSTLNLLAAAILALSFTGTATAQQERDQAARRLESITWNPIEHKLTWTVSKGSVASGKFEAADKTTYEIDMDEATMTLNGEGRRFSKSEAVSVHALMDLVSKYAAESTLWWDAGRGEPIDGDRQRVDRESEDGDWSDVAPERPRRQEPPKSIMRISAPRVVKAPAARTME